VAHNFVKRGYFCFGNGIELEWEQMRLRLPALLVLLLLSFLLPGRTYLEVRERNQRLGRLRNEVESLSDRRSELEEELAYRQSSLYVETAAREQLNYARENEVIIVLPDFRGDEEEGDEQDEISSETAHIKEREVPSWQANAKRWRALFFGD
jgi:cell division protein FtsB